MNNSTHNKKQFELNELKKHREQQKHTVQSVADGMKVGKNFVHYIESGEFEKLGAPTFVRGHVTNYCKVLGLEPGAILAQIPGDVLQHQQLKTSDAMGSSPLSHVRRQSNHFGRYAIGTALLGMLCMSFYFIWDKWSPTRDNRANQSITISQEEMDSDGEKKITYSSLIPQVSGPNYNDGSSSDLSVDQTAEDALKNNDGETLQDGLSEDTTSNENDGTTTDTPEEDQQSNLSATNNDRKSDLNTASSAYSIVMQFEEQAWVSIKTLDGDYIVQDLMGPGLREFQVTEPVHFRIGNAQKMQLSINDDSIELAPLTNKDIADFKWPLEPNS